MGEEQQELSPEQREILDAIEAFEQIVEAMPGDVTSLEALSHAYEQMGDRHKAARYLRMLGAALLDVGDLPAACELVPRLSVYADESTEVQRLIDRIQRPGAGCERRGTVEEKSVTVTDGKEKSKHVVTQEFSVAESLAMAWRLVEAGLLTNEEYSKVVEDLTELSVGDRVATLSVFHVLESRNPSSVERIMNFVAGEKKTPILALSCFETRPDAVASLPVDFMARRGVIVFDLIGKEALVALMNPYDDQLRSDVEGMVGRKCHFFITSPSEFDAALERFASVQAESASSDAG